MGKGEGGSKHVTILHIRKSPQSPFHFSGRQRRLRIEYVIECAVELWIRFYHSESEGFEKRVSLDLTLPQRQKNKLTLFHHSYYLH